VLGVLAGHDRRDPTSYVWLMREAPRGPLRIAWSPDWGRLPVDPEVKDRTAAAVAAFEELGHSVEEAHPIVGDPFAILEPLCAADGLTAFEKAGIDPARLSDSAREEVELLGRPSPVEWVGAMNELTRFRRRVEEFFERFDLILTPATAVPAFPVERAPTRIGGVPVEPRWTTFMPFPAPWNLVGSPTASIPCGCTVEGLPIGLLAAAPRAGENAIFRAAEEFEAARPWLPGLTNLGKSII
jgi:Asp-tRNA(Asn)/Glu-tRNA(Gln) amidotransferase A subunit family amidase